MRLQQDNNNYIDLQKLFQNAEKQKKNSNSKKDFSIKINANTGLFTKNSVNDHMKHFTSLKLHTRKNILDLQQNASTQQTGTTGTRKSKRKIKKPKKM